MAHEAFGFRRFATLVFLLYAWPEADFQATPFSPLRQIWSYVDTLLFLRYARLLICYIDMLGYSACRYFAAVITSRLLMMFHTARLLRRHDDAIDDRYAERYALFFAAYADAYMLFDCYAAMMPARATPAFSLRHIAIRRCLLLMPAALR